MALCPFATRQLIPAGSNDPTITPRAVIWHVAVSMVASLFDFFRFRSGGIESHFYINWRGKLYQYRDTSRQADANYQANDFAISVETAGMGLGRWNPLQRRMMKRLAVWCHEVHGIPFQRCESPTGTGFGYHTMWGAPSPWTPVAKSCPGKFRIVQFARWFVPWLAAMAQRDQLQPTPRRRRLVIRQANLWRKNKHIEADLQLLVAGRPHIVGTNEAANFIRELDQVAYEHGYRHIVDTSSRARSQNTTLIRAGNGIQILGGGIRTMCPAVGDAPERTAAVVRFKVDGQLRAHVSTHANSHVEDGGKPRRLPRVGLGFVVHMRNLVALIGDLERDGHKVTLTGDLNWAWTRRVAQWAYAPKRVLRRVGMRAQWGHRTAPAWNRRRIDYIAYDPDDLLLVEQRLVDGEHSDHPWPEAAFQIIKESRP